MHAIQATIYLLCLATSLFCLFLLARSYMTNGAKLLLWSALSFVSLAINNLLLLIDVVLLPTQVNLLPLRDLSSLAAVGILLYGFIWETD